MIYFAECGGRVKIGYSVKPNFRITKLKSDAPKPVTLIGLMEGDRDVENGIHERFSEDRVHGEWFRKSRELKEFISLNSSLPKPPKVKKTKSIKAVVVPINIDIKTLRKQIGWTQDVMAEYLGMDRSSVAHMENGRPARGPVRKLLDTLVAAVERGEAETLRPVREAAE